MRRRRRKKQRKIIIISSLTLLFIMTAGYAAFQTNLNITAKGNIKEKSRIIKIWELNSDEDFHTDFYRENIISVKFLDTNKVPNNAIESWDVSEVKDGGVQAYVIQSTVETGKYDLFIGANGGVIANRDSSNLFAYFKKIKKLDFNYNYDTSNVTNMTAMFYRCSSLTNLDLSSFNTSKVTSMNQVFDLCQGLTELNISSFDTSKVTNMNWMFSNCTSLANLNVSNFDTSNVTTMRGMFGGVARSIETLNLCSFDTRKVIDMEQMFDAWGSSKLKFVYVGKNWTTANASTINMWRSNNISSVTTGKC